MLARIGDFERDQGPFLARVVRNVASVAAERITARARPTIAADRADYGRAQAAFDHVFGLYQVQIEAAQRDPSLTLEQRGAAVVSLRQRQQTESKAARRRVIEDEKQRVRAARRAARVMMQRPSHQG